MKSGRFGKRRYAAAFALSLVLLLSVLYVCGDALLGDAWHGYILGEMTAGKQSGGSAAVTVTVPDLTLRPFSADCLDEGLFGLSVTYVENDAPPRTVLSQSPAAGSLRKAVPGEKRVPVRVAVSIGPKTISVPSVFGSEGRIAVCNLRSSGFTVKTVFLTQDGSNNLISDSGLRFRYVPRGTFDVPPPGYAVFTEPDAGAVVKVGTEVTLYVMADSPARSPVCPDVTGMTLADAERLLSGAGIRIGRIDESDCTGEPGTVTAQSRLPGTRLSPDDAVDLTVAAYAPPKRHIWDFFIIRKG